MRAFSWLAAAVLAVAVAAPVGAQTIGGRVLDRASRHPLPWLEVQVVDDSGAVLVRATTDSTGVFYAMLAAPAHVRLRFATDGRSFDSDTMSVGADAFVERELVVDLPTVFRADEVEKQVTLVPGAPPLEYPDELRRKDEPGEVVVSFVVDTSGRAVEGSLHVLSTTHPGFVPSVRKAIASRRYTPAEVGGARVRQLVETSFAFHLKLGPLTVPDAPLPMSGAWIPRARP